MTQEKGINKLTQKEVPEVRPAKLTEEHFQRIIAEVEDYAIFLLDKNGNVISWNKGAEKIKGYAADEIIGKSFRLFYSREDKEANIPDTLLDCALQTGKANHEGWRIKKDGSRFWGNVTIIALYREKDKSNITGFLKVTRDLTERKIAEDNLNIYTQHLEEKNEDLKKSEERYHKMIAEVVDYAIIMLDKDGKIQDWNKGAEKLKGYSSEEIIGKSFRRFYPREDKELKMPERILQEATEKGHVNQEGWRVRKDGSRFWASVTITCLHDETGNIIGFSKVTRDITERKKFEDRLSNALEELKQKNRELQQSEQRYHGMIAEVQDYAIILLDEDGIIQNWNAGAEYIKGYTSEEAIGKSFKIFYSQEDRDRKLPESLLQQARITGKVTHEGWRIRKGGSKFWGSVVITALHDSGNEIIGFSKVTRDLTERKNAEDSLKATAAQLDLKNQALERLNEELSSFSYVASHDLKEPLRKIITTSERILQSEELSGPVKESLQKIGHATRRMQSLIDDLLSYSEVSDTTRQFEKTDLNEVLETVKNDLEVPVSEKKAIIQSDKLPIVYGIPYQFRQLFLNLLSNALKFTKSGEPPVIKILYRSIKAGNMPTELLTGNIKYHHITIADNGIGFEPKYANKIFNAFERLHSRDIFGGTGIGLAIVKKVIDNHNGVVIASGEPGVGATFNLYLPYSNQNN